MTCDWLLIKTRNTMKTAWKKVFHLYTSIKAQETAWGGRSFYFIQLLCEVGTGKRQGLAKAT